MKKILSFFIVIASLIIGVIGIVDGIRIFIELAGANLIPEARNYYITYALSHLILGIVAVGVFIFISYYFSINKNEEKAECLVNVTPAIILLAQCIVGFGSYEYFSKVPSEETVKIASLIVGILGFIGGISLLIGCLKFNFKIRKIFSLVGEVLGIFTFGLCCFDLKDESVFTIIITIGTLLIFVICLINSIFTKEEKKELEVKQD